MDDAQRLQDRIEKGERVFPQHYRSLLESLKTQMGFTLQTDHEHPPLNKRGESEHWIRITFLG